MRSSLTWAASVLIIASSCAASDDVVQGDTVGSTSTQVAAAGSAQPAPSIGDPGDSTTGQPPTSVSNELVDGSIGDEPPSSTELDDLERILLLRPEDEAALMVAVETAVASCMNGEGFDYLIPDFSTLVEDIAIQRESNSLAFPLGDQGVEMDFVRPESGSSDPNAEVLASLTESAREAYIDTLLGPFGETSTVEMPTGDVVGFPTDGCLFDAHRAIYGSEAESYNVGLFLAGNLVISAHNRTLSSDEVIDAQQQWSGCLSAAGFSYSSFGEARDARINNLTPEDSKLLLDADLSCSQETELSSTYRMVFNRFLLAEYDVSRDQIDQLHELQENAIRAVTE